VPRDLANLPPLQQRIRAAYAMGGYASIEALAEDLTFSLSTLKRLGEGTGNAGILHVRLEEIARVCGVPLPWLESGWTADGSTPPASGEPAAADRIAELEAQVADLRKQVLTRKQIDGLIQLRLQAAGVTPAQGAASGSRPGSQRPAS
jgi:hypothetical protein